MNATKIVPALIVLLAAALACNMPAGSPPPAAAASEATATLPETLETPPQAADATETPLPSPTATLTLTPTSTVPMVTVSVNTNCRTGPGVVYDLMGALLVGEKAVVVGKYTAGNYWIINNPDGSGTCWLWGQYATVTGNTLGLPEYPPPPTPTPQLPAPPKNFQVIKQCIPLKLPQFNLIAILKWEDQADNETGYKVYINDGLFATLDPDVTQSGHSIVLPLGLEMTYGVEAFNSTGASARRSETVHCP